MRKKLSTPLHDWLPRGYAKQLDLPRAPSTTMICAVALNKRNNKEIHDALAWIALENLLSTMLINNHEKM